MVIRSAIIGLSMLAMPNVCWSQPIQSSETILHLSATGSVQVAPDQLVADLLAQSITPFVAIAQSHVNDMIAQAMQAAHSVAGVDARAIGYQVQKTADNREWMAQQTLELRSANGSALLDLTNKLQQMNFVTQSLDWRLSPALRRKSYIEATTLALKALEEQAASASATLGLHVDHFKEVQLQGQTREYSGMRLMAAEAPGGSPSPQASSTAEDISAEVSAEVLLKP